MSAGFKATRPSQLFCSDSESCMDPRDRPYIMLRYDLKRKSVFISREEKQLVVMCECYLRLRHGSHWLALWHQHLLAYIIPVSTTLPHDKFPVLPMPPNPSTNHNFVLEARHGETGAWVFKSETLKEWNARGCLLWIHGKRMFSDLLTSALH